MPPPPQTDPELVESLPFPTAAIPGVPDLMHHKYVIRDAESLWTGSMNWTADSWTREENVIVTVDSPELAARYGVDFEQLWTRRDVQKSGKVDTAPAARGRKGRASLVLPWPRRQARPSDREGDRHGHAPDPDRLARDQLGADPRHARPGGHRRQGRPRRASSTAPRSSEVLYQWKLNGNAAWKEPLLRTALTRAPFTGKHSTPYGPGTVHDYMHAKVTVTDDIAFVGSFNLSHSGELNAENVLEIADPAVADRLAAFIDDVRGRYPRIDL